MSKRTEFIWQTSSMVLFLMMATTQGASAKPTGEDWSLEPALHEDWLARGRLELAHTLRVQPRVTSARNVIAFIGDGLGISTMTAARIYKAQRMGQSMANAALVWESFPATGLVKTYNTDSQTADSAGTATALLCGEKARAGVIGVNQDVVRGDLEVPSNTHLKSILHHGMDEGKWAGIVTTTRITHATPASAYAHSSERDWEDDSALPHDVSDGLRDIAHQLVHGENNNHIRVILGGGRSHFMPNSSSDPEYPDKKGKRGDGRDLRQEWLDVHRKMSLDPSQYQYIENKTDFDSVDPSKVDYLFGMFEPGNMKYELDRVDETDGWTEPSLAEMVAKALAILKRGPKGFTLLVEGGRIDHAHHANKARKALDETVAMEKAVSLAVSETSEEDTLIFVTADHSHVFNIAGYPHINNDILGVVRGVDGSATLAIDGKPFLTLGYLNGPGYFSHRTQDGTIATEIQRVNLTGMDTHGKDYEQDAGVPPRTAENGYETHGGEDVAVYARGPMAHLFGGQHEQHYMAHAALYAACLGWDKSLCDGVSALSHTSGASSSTPRSRTLGGHWTLAAGHHAHVLTFTVATALGVTAYLSVHCWL